MEEINALVTKYQNLTDEELMDMRTEADSKWYESNLSYKKARCDSALKTMSECTNIRNEISKVLAYRKRRKHE